MSEDIVGARGKRVLYSKPFHGFIHREDTKDLKEFKNNCSRKDVHMNYDGKKKRYGWSTLLKCQNKIDSVLIPVAMSSGIDAVVFIDDVIDEFLENFKAECTKTDLAKEISSFRKNTISKTVYNMNKK